MPFKVASKYLRQALEEQRLCHTFKKMIYVYCVTLISYASFSAGQLHLSLNNVIPLKELRKLMVHHCKTVTQKHVEYLCVLFCKSRQHRSHTPYQASATNLPINRMEKLYILFISKIRPENKKNSDETSISKPKKTVRL